MYNTDALCQYTTCDDLSYTNSVLFSYLSTHVLLSLHFLLIFFFYFPFRYQARANEVTDIARENIRMSIAQVDKLQDMEEKSANLEQSSQDFHRGAKRVRKLMCVRSWKMLSLIVIGVIILLLIIIVPIAVQASKK